MECVGKNLRDPTTSNQTHSPLQEVHVCLRFLVVSTVIHPPPTCLLKPYTEISIGYSSNVNRTVTAHVM